MNGVIGLINLLMETTLNHEQHEFAETIKTSADSLLCIINDILDLSKIEAGKMNFENRDFDLHDPIKSTVELPRRACSKKGLALSFPDRRRVPVSAIGWGSIPATTDFAQSGG